MSGVDSDASFGADPTTREGLEDLGGEYRLGLSSASGAAPFAAGAYAWMEGRFSGMRVLVTAVVQD